MYGKIYSFSLFLLTTFIQCNSYTMVVHNDVRVNLTCILPPDIHATKLVVIKGNLKNNTFKVTIDIHNAGEDSICYCNDPDKEYNVELPRRSSRNDEGRYRCIFYYNKTESYRHIIELRVMPQVDAYAVDDVGRGLIDFIINRTRTMEDSEVKVDARAGGVVLSEDTRLVEYKKYHECEKVVANKNYTDFTTEVIFTVSYKGLSRDYIASIISCDDKEPRQDLSVVLISGSFLEYGEKSRYKRWLE